MLLNIYFSVLRFVDRCLPYYPFSFHRWPLCCLCFFDLRILITLLISSNSSIQQEHKLILKRKASGQVYMSVRRISFTSVYNFSIAVWNKCYLALESSLLYITKNTDSKYYIRIYETKSALDKQKINYTENCTRK